MKAKTISQCQQLWNEVGFNDTIHYFNFLRGNFELSKENKLKIYNFFNPDKINPKTFWKATDVHFFTDTVANSCDKHGNGVPHDIETANKNNYQIFLNSGGSSAFELVKYNYNTNIFISKLNKCKKILDLGCGYGSLRLHDFEDFEYIGYDIIKRFKGAKELMGKHGSFSDRQISSLKNKISVIISSNVFQHLSKSQIEKYFQQFEKINPKYLILSYVRCENTWSFHYGQWVELFSSEEFVDLATKYGFKLCQKTEQYLSGFDPIFFLFDNINWSKGYE